jgi:uncharacterized protein involved in cysteine biosynthesis
MFSAWVQRWINQIAHVGWAGFLTLLLAGHIRLAYAALAVFLFASIKEAVFDPLTETKAEQGSGWEDWAFWLLGIGLGALSLLVKWR